MGCVYSQRRHHSRSNSSLDSRRLFSVRAPIYHEHFSTAVLQVCNVDDSGQEVNFGKIEITDHELCLHQKGRNSIYWSLR